MFFFNVSRVTVFDFTYNIMQKQKMKVFREAEIFIEQQMHSSDETNAVPSECLLGIML